MKNKTLTAHETIQNTDRAISGNGQRCILAKQAFDASYSSHNYKHANKANIASRKKLDRVVPLQPTLVQGGSEYKHLFNQSFLVVKGVVKTKKPFNIERAISTQLVYRG